MGHGIMIVLLVATSSLPFCTALDMQPGVFEHSKIAVSWGSAHILTGLCM